MFNEFLAKNINAVYGGGDYANTVARQYKGHNIIPAMVHHGFGQVEPNHLSAQRTSQVYAQLPAASDIEVLQQGQFVKYNYAKGVVDFDATAPGEWMLVYNEIKLYRDFQDDCEFAMIKDNYQARIYSPFGGSKGNDKVGIFGVQKGSDWENTDIFLGKQSRYYNGVDSNGKDHYDFTVPATYKVATEYAADTTYYTKNGDEYTKATVADADAFAAGTFYVIDTEEIPGKVYKFDDVTAAPDMYEMHYNEDPYHIYGLSQELKMPEGTQMVPRVLKTNIGDIFTTNTVDAAITSEDIQVGKLLTPRNDDGILIPTTTNTGMLWQIAKIYTMPDHQPGVKIMRVQ